MAIQFTPEQIEKAKECKTVEEFLAFEKESNMELTEAEATNLFAQLNPTNGELSDSELETVSGGCGGTSCPKGGEHDWHFTGNTRKTFSQTNCRDRDEGEYECSKCHEKAWFDTETSIGSYDN